MKTGLLDIEKNCLSETLTQYYIYGYKNVFL